jgi:hypothetical protein
LGGASPCNSKVSLGVRVRSYLQFQSHLQESRALFGIAETYSEASWWLAGPRSSWLKKQLVTALFGTAETYS